MLNSGDIAWVLAATALVLVMTLPGVALFYGGLVRQKNVISMIMLSFFTLCFISLQWVFWGYTLAFGPDQYHLIGNFDWLSLKNVGLQPNSDYAATIPHQLFMAFQMMFAVITPALITGAVAERMRFVSFALFLLLWATFVYDPLAHWVWAKEGWLRNLGVLDFAGGTVVHISSGVAALICALVLGRRQGYGQVPMRPHNLPLTTIGGALLWFGWFGFNAGSALKANEIAAAAFLNTNTAAAAAGLTWMAIDWKINGKPTLLGGITGSIAGLVGITPAAGYVSVESSIYIGVAASFCSYIAITFLKQKLHYDDSLDAFGVHGAGGIAGAVLTGVYADKLINADGNNGWLSGNPGQLYIQLVGILVAILYVSIMTYIILKIVEYFTGLRVSEDEEQLGLDKTQHEESAYTLLDDL